jgi:CheY-like chemotaxis protein
VLIIDDDPLVGRAVVRLLREDHDTIWVASGEEALGLLGPRHWFDVILCDVLMPGMSGMELHARLAAELPHIAERLLFFSGNCESPEVLAFARQANVTVLAKPFQPDQLRAAIRARLEQRR